MWATVLLLVSALSLPWSLRVAPSDTAAGVLIFGPNLLPNPSFEDGGGNWPNGWIPAPNQIADASFSWDRNLGHTGSGSAVVSAGSLPACCPLNRPGWSTNGQ